MGLKKQELIDGCFAHAADDEPLFVLKATDELAPEIVREWARRYLLSKMETQATGGENARLLFGYIARKQYAKYQEALHLADQMESWANRKMQS